MDTTAIIHSSSPAEMSIQIAELEQKIKNFTDTIEHYQYTNRMYEGQIDLLIDTLTWKVTSDGMDKDIAEELAGCFGRTLSRTVNVNFCIHGTMELTIPVDAVIGDLEDEFDILIQPSYTSEVVMEWDDIHSIEIEEA